MATTAATTAAAATQKNMSRRSGERNGTSKTGSAVESPWTKAMRASSQWPDKEEFLDVVYYLRQILGIVLGLAWGIVPLRGFLAIALFCVVNAGLIYGYCTAFQKVDEDEMGGTWEITKEGFMTSFAGFLVTWIIVYSGLHQE